MPRRQEDAVSAQDFTIEFGMIRDTFEASADDSVDLTEGSGRVASLGKAARSVIGIGAASLTPLVSGVASASAKGGEYGIFEGKTVSFVHPIIMVRMEVFGAQRPGMQHQMRWYRIPNRKKKILGTVGIYMQWVKEPFCSVWDIQIGRAHV